MELAEEYNISPWDALLAGVRRAAARVLWVDAQLAEAIATCDGDTQDRAVTHWLRESRKERGQLARMSKSAIDAGVAERMVAQVEMNTKIIVRVLATTLDVLELDPDQRIKAHEAVHAELLRTDGLEPSEDSRG